MLLALAGWTTALAHAPGGGAAAPAADARVDGTNAAAADAVVAEVRRATERYRDIEQARAAGFVQITGMEPRHGYHFMKPSLAALAGTVDLANPPILLYVERDGVWQLVGVEYMLPVAPASGPLPREAWDRHEAACHYRDWTELPAARAADCPTRHPQSQSPLVLWHPAAAVAHVWAWMPNPDGPFARANRALDPWGGVTKPGTHRHGLNAAEVAYSEFNHRICGAMLLVIALTAVASAALPRARTPRWIAAPLWILFGAYIFVTADPEAWPIGAGTFADVFTDGLVLQHKVLSLIPMVLGIAEAARAAGTRVGVAWVAPVLAILGGAGLFFHGHDGGLHFDRTFLQHAAMGGVAIVAGAALIAVRQRAAWSARLRWAWPVLLGLTSLVLLLYSE